ncbi:MAG: hypothetical protein EPO28_10890 [Saprospiraceae bacterium]|nr:MAG: hypothetical protein EPO28_10890 [Saprospiraceae bacterium]
MSTRRISSKNSNYFPASILPVISTCGATSLTKQGHKSSIYGAAFHPDGRYAVSSSSDHTVKFWDTQTGRCTLTLHGFKDELFKTGVLDGGRGIVVTETQGVVHVIRF